ncbi:MAG: response regulator [Bacteroidetes bacterium]|nr:response regulator [Bacteroidota bacterium]
MNQYAIICVDDDPMITQLLSFQLRKWIDPISTIIETLVEPKQVMSTLEEMQSLGFRVIFFIVDYQMPGLNGAQLIRTVKEKYPKVHFIMLSGQANEVVVAQLREELSLDNFISKPWNEEQLHAMIKPYLNEMGG